MKSPIRKRIFGIEFEAHPIVFPVSAGLLLLFVLLTAADPREALILFTLVKDFIADSFSWLYVGSMTGFLALALWLGYGRFGSIKLGRDDDDPEFSTMSWFAMLFSAGMGIGMLFFGVVEPMFHLMGPPTAEANTSAGARQAMAVTFFHWCLHPWALYAVVAMALAYFGFRRGLPLSFRSVFYPLLGERIHGRIGDLIDTMAVLATLFGLATSLGLGAKQVNAGLAMVFGIPQSETVQIIIIGCITMAAVGSLISGLNAGIRRLSEINMVLAGLLLLFLFVAGPTVRLLGALVENVGTYISSLPVRSFDVATYEEEGHASWLGSWTIFYWGWWIAWSPFVGMFIARVSRGRTIREFVTGVLLVPTGAAALWMTGMGNSAIFNELEALEAEGSGRHHQTYQVLERDERHELPLSEEGDLVAPDARGVASPMGILVEDDGRAGLVSAERHKAVAYHEGVLIDRDTGAPYEPAPGEVFDGRYRAQEKSLSLGGYISSPVLSADRRGRQDTTATALFVMFESYPLAWLTAIIATLSVILFFVTSSDSASMVADIIASGGSEDPALGTRLFWGILEGVLASVLLLAGGLKALQTGSIALGLPFCALIIVMCYSLIRGLSQDRPTEEASKEEVS